MSLENEFTNGIRIISPRGQLNSNNAGEVENEILAWIGAGERKMVLDMEHLEYISSAGLRVVLVAAKKLRQEKGQLVLCALSPSTQEVFEISGFLTILDVVPTRAEALARIQA